MTIAEINKPGPDEETSKSGSEEEVIGNGSEKKSDSGVTSATRLPIKDKIGKNETEGERRFKEGMANNNDTEE